MMRGDVDLRSFSRNYKDWLKICLLAAGFLILASLTAQYIVSHNAWQNSDFFTFWAAGKLVVSGHNPYDQVEWLAVHRAAGSTWFPNPALVYPLPAALLFVPLAKLPLPQAAFVWLVISQFLVLGAVLFNRHCYEMEARHDIYPIHCVGSFFLPPHIDHNDQRATQQSSALCDGGGSVFLVTRPVVLGRNADRTRCPQTDRCDSFPPSGGYLAALAAQMARAGWNRGDPVSIMGNGSIRSAQLVSRVDFNRAI